VTLAGARAPRFGARKLLVAALAIDGAAGFSLANQHGDPGVCIVDDPLQMLG
jgi:hypothetical protein